MLREALGSRARITFTIACGQLFCGHEACPIVPSAASRAPSEAEVLRLHPFDLPFALDDNAVAVFLVLKHGVAHACFNGLVDQRTIFDEDAVWVLWCNGLHCSA